MQPSIVLRHLHCFTWAIWCTAGMAWPLKSVLLTMMCLVCNEIMVQSRKSVFREKQLQIGQNVSHRYPVKPSLSDKELIQFGIILPKTSLITLKRQYQKKISDTLESLKKGKSSFYSIGKHFIWMRKQIFIHWYYAINF